MKGVENESTHVNVRSGFAVGMMCPRLNEHVSSKPHFKYTEVNNEKDCLLIPGMVSVKE